MSTEPAGKAVPERLECLNREQEETLKRVQEIQRIVKAHAPAWWFTYDYDADLYGEQGSPH